MTSAMRYYRARRSLLLSELGGVCVVCGAWDHLEVHHAEGENNHSSHIGGWQQLIKLEKEHVRGVPLVVLCHDCHVSIHGSAVDP